MAEKGGVAARGKKDLGSEGKKRHTAGKHASAVREKAAEAKKLATKKIEKKKAGVKAQKKTGKEAIVGNRKAKPGRTAGKAETKKESAAAKKKKKGRPKKTAVQKALEKIKERIKEKARHVFTGRFGKRMIRRHGRGKWARWRHPGGIDIRHAQQYGLVPKSGYRTPHSIRFLHPSGMREALVYNAKSLGTVPKGCAVRIAAGVGAAKRSIIAKEAKKLNLKILNV